MRLELDYLVNLLRTGSGYTIFLVLWDEYRLPLISIAGCGRQLRPGGYLLGLLKDFSKTTTLCRSCTGLEAYS